MRHRRKRLFVLLIIAYVHILLSVAVAVAFSKSLDHDPHSYPKVRLKPPPPYTLLSARHRDSSRADASATRWGAATRNGASSFIRHGSAPLHTIHIFGLFEFSAPDLAASARAEAVATQLAIEHINAVEYVPHYRLKVHYADSKVSDYYHAYNMHSRLPARESMNDEIFNNLCKFPHHSIASSGVHAAGQRKCCYSWRADLLRRFDPGV